MLIATKDKAGVHLDEGENDFMLDNAYGDNTLEELNITVIMMARIQPTDDNSDAKPTYDVEFITKVNASQIDMINGLFSKKRVKEFENKPDQYLDYKEAYEELKNAMNVEKEQLLNKKEEIQDELLKTRDETLKIKHETELHKRAFKERGNKYLEDIVSLEEKLKSPDRIVYKMSHSLQTIHMLGKKPNMV
ncbi:hypothetical protein Tco_0789408 [Tanacetum coccineum]